MKITIEHEGLIITVEDKEAVVMDDVIQLIRQALAGTGFHADTIKEYLGER